MRTVYEARASTVLFRLVSAVPDEAGLFLLPANVCPVVPLALLAAGRRFEFIDLDPQTLCLSEALLHRRLTAQGWPPVAGVVFVRTYGVEVEAGPTFRALKTSASELLVIDDRCLCRPRPDAVEPDLQGADAVLFSTGYAKPVDLGRGGFAHLAADVPYADRRRDFRPADLERVTALYKSHIRSRAPLYRDPAPAGGRSALRQLRWLDTALPAVAWSRYRDLVLAKREESDAHRARINAIYRTAIPPTARLPAGYHGWRFQIRLAEPARLLAEIFAQGFFASDHYFPTAFLFGGHPSPAAAALHGEIVNLFNDFRVSESDAEKIGRIVARHLEKEPRRAAARP